METMNFGARKGTTPRGAVSSLATFKDKPLNNVPNRETVPAGSLKDSLWMLSRLFWIFWGLRPVSIPIELFKSDLCSRTTE